MPKYKNPDKRCKLPYIDDKIGYCWGYADKIDKKKTKKEIEAWCKSGVICRYFKEAMNEKTN